jgi:hypothetical protein
MLAATPFLVASVIYHQDWIRDNLRPTHPIFSSRLWTSTYLRSLKDSVVTGINRTDSSSLVATGLPRHIVQANQISELESEVSRLNGLIESLPVSINDMIIGNLSSVNGIQVANDATISRHIAPLMLQLNAIQASLRPADSAQSQEPLSTPGQFQWGGRFHPVPQGFVFPRCTTMALWSLWIYGDQNLGIGPYRHIKARSLPREDKTQLSKANFVMKSLITKSRQTESQLEAKPRSETDALLSTAFQTLLERLGVRTNVDVIHFTVIYAHLKKLNASVEPDTINEA